MRPDDDKQPRFLDGMAERGFVIRAKPIKLLRDADGDVVDRKGDLDVD